MVRTAHTNTRNAVAAAAVALLLAVLCLAVPGRSYAYADDEVAMGIESQSVNDAAPAEEAPAQQDPDPESTAPDQGGDNLVAPSETDNIEEGNAPPGGVDDTQSGGTDPAVQNNEANEEPAGNGGSSASSGQIVSGEENSINDTNSAEVKTDPAEANEEAAPESKPAPKITLDANGGALPEGTATTVENTVTLPGASRGGYVFLGWSADPNVKLGDDDKQAGATYTATEDTTLYAIWGKLYTVQRAKPASPAPAQNGTQASAAQSQSQPQRPTTYQATSIATANANHTAATLAAQTIQTQASTVNIRLNLNDDTKNPARWTGSVSHAIDTPEAGSTYYFPFNVERDNYLFLGWDTSATATAPTYLYREESVAGSSFYTCGSITANSNQTFYAIWTPRLLNGDTSIMNDPVGSAPAEASGAAWRFYADGTLEIDGSEQHHVINLPTTACHGSRPCTAPTATARKSAKSSSRTTCRHTRSPVGSPTTRTLLQQTCQAPIPRTPPAWSACSTIAPT